MRPPDPWTPNPASPPQTSVPNAWDPHELLWKELLSASYGLPAGGLLASHPKAAEYTAEIQYGMSPRRLVAVSNSLYNRCNPKRLTAAHAATCTCCSLAKTRSRNVLKSCDW